MRLLKEIVPPFLRSGFTPLKFAGLYDEQLSVPVLCNGTETEFLLSELLESAMLNGKFTQVCNYTAEEVPSHNAQSNSSDCNQSLQDSNDECVDKKGRYDFARLYQRALCEIQYHDNDTQCKVNEHIKQWFECRKKRELDAAFKRSKPKEKLSLDYDHDLVQLVFQMRRHLFILPDITLTPTVLGKIFQYYAEFDFDKNSVAEIFVQDKEEQPAHYRIKCEIVFGLNLYYMLEKANLLDAFRKLVLRKKPKTNASYINCTDNPSVSDSAPVKKYGENISCFSQNSASDDSYCEMIPNNSLPEHLSFIEPLFRIVNINKNPLGHSF
ncbi:hypothetical protein ENBRE01_2967 [Enteropsectra breve]|nr:hypothetical protein ENBRE01_2967 [Enteropsectra breve]